MIFECYYGIPYCMQCSYSTCIQHIFLHKSIQVHPGVHANKVHSAFTIQNVVVCFLFKTNIFFVKNPVNVHLNIVFALVKDP